MLCDVLNTGTQPNDLVITTYKIFIIYNMYYNMKDNLRLITTCVVSLISNYVYYMTTKIKHITHTQTLVYVQMMRDMDNRQ